MLKKKETCSLGRSGNHDYQVLTCHKFAHISPFSENIQFPWKSIISYLYLFWVLLLVLRYLSSKFRILVEGDVLLLVCITSQHKIITSHHHISCYIINFNDHISSYFLQTIAHLIHFLYHSLSHSDLPYLVTFISYRHSTLLLFLLSTNLHSGN